MYILTDGKNYVMENPLKNGELMVSTSPVYAKNFTYKQAKSILQSPSKKYSWIKNGYYMVNGNTGEKSDTSVLYQKGNGGAYIGDNDIEFDEHILDLINQEVNSILSLAGWNITQIETYRNLLLSVLSKTDSEETDVLHALQEYEERNNGKKPPAHKITKIGYILEDIRIRRKNIKRCLRFINVMRDAINNQYTIEKTKYELSLADDVAYKARTEMYQKAIDILY